MAKPKTKNQKVKLWAEAGVDKPVRKSYTIHELDQLIAARMPEPNPYDLLVKAKDDFNESNLFVDEARRQLADALDRQALAKSNLSKLAQHVKEIGEAASR